jgi:hypothetical protein
VITCLCCAGRSDLGGLGRSHFSKVIFVKGDRRDVCRCDRLPGIAWVAEAILCFGGEERSSLGCFLWGAIGL